MNFTRSNRGSLLVFIFGLVAVSFQFAGCVGGVSTEADASPSPANAKLSVTPNSVSVTASVGSSATQSVTASNTGSGALTIHQVTVTGSGFSLSGLEFPAMLAAGTAKTFAVAFTPARCRHHDRQPRSRQQRQRIANCRHSFRHRRLSNIESAPIQSTPVQPPSIESSS